MAGTLTVGRQEKTVLLPAVRQDLMLYRAESDSDGAPLWHLHDPLSNKFYRLEERDVELLALVGFRDAKEVARVANKFLGAEINEREVEDLIRFLRVNNLVKYDDEQKGYYKHALENMSQQDWWLMFLKNPIFFRIPLWQPDKFLDRTLPWVRWIGSKPAIVAFVVMTVLGFYLMSRQIDQFFATFMFFFNLSGMVIYLSTLFFVKVLHELGHAYVAKALGCRVPVIGVAFLVGWPVFYTDTSDAWKIADRSKRLAIGAAGVGVELAIASLSLLLWSLSPEGVVKSAFFLLATTTWLLSIAVNFNPLMRFDGYYLFSDLLRVPNLERRSFDMARWRLREALFGLGDDPPEPYRRAFVIFAFSVWIYRFFLFLGIALLVYNFFFRAAGIALFLAEVYLLIGRPVFRELAAWWKMRDRIHFNAHTLRSLGAVGLLLAVLFIPWRTDVSAPALLEGRISDIYLPEAGQVRSVLKEGSAVAEGDVIFEIDSPQLDHELELVRARHEELRWTQASLGFDAKMRSQATVVGSALRTQNQRLRSLFEKRQQMSIKAPFTGNLVDVAPDVATGDWLPQGVRVATVVDRSQTRVTAYLLEEELSRIEAGMSARFYPENPEFPVVDATVLTVSFVGSGQLDKLYLASLFGGDIAVRETDDGGMSMVQSHYVIDLAVDNLQVVPNQVVRGTVQIDGHPVSIFSQLKRKFLSVFVRETGF